MFQKIKIFRLIVSVVAVCLMTDPFQEALGADQNGVLMSAGCKTEYFLVKDLADSFNETGPLSVVPKKTGNKVAIKLLEAGKIHFAFTCKPMEALLENISVAKEQADHWTSRIIASDPIVVLVHRDNPVKSLSLEQIHNIFTGKVNSWKEVGGEALEIQVAYLDLTANSGVLAVFKELVLGENKDGSLLVLKKDAVKVSSPENLGAIVSQNKGAISFMGFASYRERYGFLINVNDVVPSQETILNNSYPLMVNYYIISDQRKSKELRPFFSFMESDEGKNIANRNFIARPDK